MTEYSNLTVEELRKRCSEVWPDASFTIDDPICGEGIESAHMNGTNIVLEQWYVSSYNYAVRYREIKRGMKRRPEAADYILGKRDNFND